MSGLSWVFQGPAELPGRRAELLHTPGKGLTPDTL